MRSLGRCKLQGASKIRPFFGFRLVRGVTANSNQTCDDAFSHAKQHMVAANVGTHMRIAFECHYGVITHTTLSAYKSCV